MGIAKDYKVKFRKRWEKGENKTKMTRLVTFCRYFSVGVVASVLMCTRHCIELSDIYTRELLVRLDALQGRCNALRCIAEGKHLQRQ